MHIEFGYGLLSYRNVGYALFATAKQIFQTGSSRLIVLYKQTTSRLYVELYFYSFILIMYSYCEHRSYIYLNIFFAMIIYSKEEEQKAR